MKLALYALLIALCVVVGMPVVSFYGFAGWLIVLANSFALGAGFKRWWDARP